LKLPPVKLDFIRSLTDDTGLLQHAKFGTPRREEGYTTDDNARALIALAKYFQAKGSSEIVDRLIDTYLSFVLHMQKKDGKMHNFLSYDRRFMDYEASEDCMGRTIWSCGYVIASNLSSEKRLIGKEIFDKLLPWAFFFKSPRSKAFAIMGLKYYQKAYPEDPNLKKSIQDFVEKLLGQYKTEHSKDWRWFESYLTYANGRLPQALFGAHQELANPLSLQTAKESIDFLLEVQMVNGTFVPIGNRGWYKKGEKRAMYDQQSVEAATMTEAALEAYKVTGQIKYKNTAERIFNWFFGENTLKVQVYHSDIGGCYDGITPQGLNLNMGAEAIVCYLSARLEIETPRSPTVKKLLPSVS
jgi:hypothetical protein